jgi:hypothetical protein
LGSGTNFTSRVVVGDLGRHVHHESDRYRNRSRVYGSDRIRVQVARGDAHLNVEVDDIVHNAQQSGLIVEDRQFGARENADVAERVEQLQHAGDISPFPA